MNFAGRIAELLRLKFTCLTAGMQVRPSLIARVSVGTVSCISVYGRNQKKLVCKIHQSKRTDPGCLVLKIERPPKSS